MLSRLFTMLLVGFWLCLVAYSAHYVAENVASSLDDVANTIAEGSRHG